MMTYEEAAKALGVSHHTVRKLAKRRLLTVVKLGYRTIRIRPIDLEKCKERLAR